MKRIRRKYLVHGWMTLYDRYDNIVTSIRYQSYEKRAATLVDWQTRYALYNKKYHIVYQPDVNFKNENNENNLLNGNT